ncbi:MAG: hypothetical protein O7E52_06270 [Candidatus Poribacteria bacterium]|nr:hypothetical protein [Candidatus Poribacteria bacterium]
MAVDKIVDENAQTERNEILHNGVAVVVDENGPELERFAAGQLCDYLDKLFGIRIHPTSNVPAAADALFLIGGLNTNPAVHRAAEHHPFPTVSEQGVVLRRLRFQDCPALIVGGGSPRATLWAVYELVERWGVRYLLHGDVLPVERSAFQLPDVDVVMEPTLPVRQWRVINDFACGPESWGMADYRPVIDQLAKLKFNRIFLSIWPWQPFLHYEVKGVQRESATLWFDFHYPITDDMVGRHLFGEAEEFWNPDLPRNASYAELMAAGERLVHNLMDYAHRRGMECVIVATLTEFPPEFAPLLTDAQKVHQLAELTIVPSAETDIDDPALTELAAAVLRATVNTYPEADYVALGMPEFRQWSGLYERAWQALDGKYNISAQRSLDDVLGTAAQRTGYAGGAERALQEVKGDIVALYFYDRLLNGSGAKQASPLQNTRRSDMKFIYNSVAEELFPVLGCLLPRGWETLNFVDYTASRIVKRREVLKSVPSRDIPCSLIYTLHDDNVGVLPQLTTGSLHELTQDLRGYGWAGFSTRYWLTSDHDPCIAYLAQAAWNAGATPDAVYRDQIRAVCGDACVEDILTVFREVEATTVALETHGLGLTFPVPGMLMKQWTPQPMSAELIENRQGYQRALDAARRAQGEAQPSGRSYVGYWVGRLEFGIGYLEMIAAVRLAAIAEADGKRIEALKHAEAALTTACAALEAYARVARDQSDRGAIAVMNEYIYRPLKAKVAALSSD